MESEDTEFKISFSEMFVIVQHNEEDKKGFEILYNKFEEVGKAIDQILPKYLRIDSIYIDIRAGDGIIYKVKGVNNHNKSTSTIYNYKENNLEEIIE